MPNGTENTNPNISPYTGDDPLGRKDYTAAETVELSKKFDDKEFTYNFLKAALNLESLRDVNSQEDLKQIILDSGFFEDQKDPAAQNAVIKINLKLTETLNSRIGELHEYVALKIYNNGESGEAIIIYSDEDTIVSQNQNVAQTADPINLFNGNFVYSSTDLVINGAGMDFAFTRNYSQLSIFNSILGYKWDHSYNLWLRLSSDTNLIFRSNGALRETTYRRQNIHNYWFADFGEEGVIFEKNHRFIWRAPDGVEFRYAVNLSGRADILLIDRIEDRFGNYLQFTYNNALLIKVEVNSPVRFVTFDYDSENRIIQISDFTNRSWKYAYDDMGDLVAVTTPFTEEYRKGLTTCYEYSSYQFSSVVQQHNLLSITDASGQIYLENEYGTEPNLLSFNRVIRQREGSGEIYLEYADVIENFEFPYTAHQTPSYQTIETNRSGQQIRYLFNRYGNMVFREEYARINGVPKLIGTHYRYNQDGNLVGTISPTGIITQFLYGRDYYERKQQVDVNYLATDDNNLTKSERQGFNRMLASIRRGKYYNINTLNMAQGLWSQDIFPDIFAVSDDDIFQKFDYEPEFGQPLSISDPRYTKSPNPKYLEDADYSAHLTKYQYKIQNGSPYYLLDTITSPIAKAPNGLIIGSSVSKFLTYDIRGRLTKSEDPIGLESVSEYFTNGTIEGLLEKSILDPTGFNIQSGVERDNLGRPIKTFEPRFFEFQFQNGRFVTEAKINELGQVTETISTSPFDISSKRKYNKAGNLVENLQEVKDAKGNFIEDMFSKTTYIYDQEFRLIKTKHGNKSETFLQINKTVYDGANRPALSISPMGRKTKTVYNERSLPFKEIVDYGGIGINTKKYYDAEGRVVRLIDSRGGTTRIKYDAFSRPVQTTNSEGHVTCISYDKLGNKLTERFFEQIANKKFILQYRMEFHYDELGRLIKQGVNIFENNTDEINENDLPDAYLNIGLGRLLISLFFYDIGGRLIKMIDQSNRVSLQEYDLLGRKTKQIDPYGNEVSFEYDTVGNLIRLDKKEVIKDTNDQIIGSRHFATQNIFDELNRVIETTDTLGNKTIFKYDTRGLLEKTINALGEETDNSFDVFGRLLKTIQYLKVPANPLQKTPVTIAYQYDLDNFITKQIDALGRETAFLYNSLGNNIATVLPDLSKDQKEYDFSGMLKSYKDRNGLINLYNRDIAGRIIGSQLDKTQLDVNLTIEGADFSMFKFDSLGRLIQAENDFNICQYLYNSLGWLQKETSATKPFLGGVATQPFVTVRSYNDNGTLTNITYPSGRQLEYGLDILDRITKIEQKSKGNNFTGNNSTANNYTIASIEYEGLQRKSLKRANNIHTEYNYDFGGRMVGIKHLSLGNSLLTIQFLYDSVGNMRQKAELANGLQLTKGFDYDELHRLKNVNTDNVALIQDLTNIQPSSIQLPYPIPNTQGIIDGLVNPIGNLEKKYTLDSVGNRKVVRQVATADVNYSVNALDQYTQIEGQLFAYDKNGNLIEDPQSEYRYDANNRLTSVWNKGTGLNIMSYQYDAFGKKVVESQNGTTKQYIYSAINPIEEYENTVLKSTNVLDMGMDNFIQINTNSQDLYLLSDLVKSTRLVLNGNQIEDFYNYDEFGAIIGQNPVSGQYLFQGKKWINEIGKYDYLTRFYDPALGRFQQRDLKGYADGTNLYAFVRNNPLNWIDPFGTERKETGGSLWKSIDRVLEIANHNGIGAFVSFAEEATEAHNYFGKASKLKILDNFLLKLASKLPLNKPSIYLANQLGNIVPRIQNSMLLPARLAPSFFAPGWNSSLPMSKMSAGLSLFGIYYNGKETYNAIFKSNKSTPERIADATFNGAGFLSSSIGTTNLIGWGLSRAGVGAGTALLNVGSKINPVASAAAGGYAIGQLIDGGVGWATGKTWHDHLSDRAIGYKESLQDAGLDETWATIIAAPTNIPLFSEAQKGLGWGAFKVYEGGSAVVDWTESRDWNPINGVDRLLDGDWPLW